MAGAMGIAFIATLQSLCRLRTYGFFAREIRHTGSERREDHGDERSVIRFSLEAQEPIATTPQGCSPTGTDLTTLSLSTSMMEMSLELPLVV